MIQNGFYVSLRKTDIVNVDSDVHCLPPDFGPVQEFAVADYVGCPKEWSKDGVFVKVEEGQPLWIDFRGNVESAVLVAVQRLNPVTGLAADLESGLSKEPKQNYLKLPEQLWIDGYVKDGKVYQFMVTKAGEGLAVNEYVLPKHMRDSHAIGFAFYAPKVERQSQMSQRRGILKSCSFMPMALNSMEMGSSTMDFDDGPVASAELFYASNQSATPQNSVLGGEQASCSPIIIGAPGTVDRFTQNRVLNNFNDSLDTVDILASQEETKFDEASMGMGGRIGQEVIRDNNTVDYYQDKPAALLTVYLALPEQFDAIMKKGKTQDVSRPDKYIHSGEIDGVQVPLIGASD